MTQHYRIGVLPALHALWSPLYWIGQLLVISFAVTLTASINPLLSQFGLSLLIIALPTLGVLNAVFAGVALWRINRTARGTKGRTRLWILCVVGVISALSSGLVPVTVFHTPLLTLLVAPSIEAWHDMLVDLPWWMEGLFYVQGGTVAASWLIVVGTSISCWWLVPDGVRRVLWIVVDVIATVGFLVAVNVFPVQPPHGHPDQLLGPIIRLLFTVLFVLRAVARALPPGLDLLETSGYRWLVAARLLRGRKSGFLAAIGVLSILAVTVSSCALTTVLSVMGGFRSDLKRKILGNNAHIVVDRDHGDMEGWLPVLERARSIGGVTGASPYVGGEVMISSVANQGGAVLRGIDPQTIGQVTDLARNLRIGRLAYLEHPDRLLELPAEQMRCATLPIDAFVDDGPPLLDDHPPTGSFLRDVDHVVGTPDAGMHHDDDPRDDGLAPFLLDHGPLQHVEARHVLPGVVVGQELARSLRLCLGDEVTVVTPFGGVGPTGPIPKTRTFRVAGIFYSGMYEFDMKYVYVMLPVAQQFLSTGDAISGVEIKVAEVERAPEIARQVRTAIHRSDLRVRDWQELNRNLFGALALEKLAMFITLGIAILVAGFCVFGTLMLMVQEKKKEVGVLQAMGIAPQRIVEIFLLEGVLIGVLGAAIGLGAGYVSCFWIEHFGIKMNPEVYYIDRLPVNIDGMEFLLVALASVAVCVLATIRPAFVASRLKPVDALRFE